MANDLLPWVGGTCCCCLCCYFAIWPLLAGFFGWLLIVNAATLSRLDLALLEKQGFIQHPDLIWEFMQLPVRWRTADYWDTAVCYPTVEELTINATQTVIFDYEPVLGQMSSTFTLSAALYVLGAIILVGCMTLFLVGFWSASPAGGSFILTLYCAAFIKVGDMIVESYATAGGIMYMVALFGIPGIVFGLMAQAKVNMDEWFLWSRSRRGSVNYILLDAVTIVACYFMTQRTNSALITIPFWFMLFCLLRDFPMLFPVDGFARKIMTLAMMGGIVFCAANTKELFGHLIDFTDYKMFIVPNAENWGWLPSIVGAYYTSWLLNDPLVNDALQAPILYGFYTMFHIYPYMEAVCFFIIYGYLLKLSSHIMRIKQEKTKGIYSLLISLGVTLYLVFQPEWAYKPLVTEFLTKNPGVAEASASFYTFVGTLMILNHSESKFSELVLGVILLLYTLAIICFNAQRIFPDFVVLTAVIRACVLVSPFLILASASASLNSQRTITAWIILRNFRGCPRRKSRG